MSLFNKLKNTVTKVNTKGHTISKSPRVVRIWRNIDDNFWGIYRLSGYSMASLSQAALAQNQINQQLSQQMSQAQNLQGQHAVSQQQAAQNQQGYYNPSIAANTIANSFGQIVTHTSASVGTGLSSWLPQQKKNPGRQYVNLEFKGQYPRLDNIAYAVSHELEASVDDTAYDIIAPLNEFLKKRNR